MSARRDILLAVGGLLTLHVLTTFTALGVLGRMSPAIERIRGENLRSVEAAGEMLAVLGAHTPVADDAAARFQDALASAEQNVTENDERQVLGIVRDLATPALAGPGAERGQVVDALRELVRINLDVTEAADLEAQRLGLAGGWAVAAIGLVALGLGWIAVHRLRRGVLQPPAHLRAVAADHRRGDPHRRVGALPHAPELDEAGRLVDSLLDERAGWARLASDPSDEPDVLRRALLHLLDRDTTASFVLDDAGKPVACSRKALDMLGRDTDGSLKRDLVALVRGVAPAHPGWSAEQVGDGSWLVRYEPTEA